MNNMYDSKYGNMYELECKFDSKQDFCRKAYVVVNKTKGEHGETILKNLYSYCTLVAKVLYSFIDGVEKITYISMGKYSQTTTRHQKEFFKQQGLSDKEIKELFKNGILEKEV